MTDLGSGTDDLTRYLAARAHLTTAQYTRVAVGAGSTFIAALQHGRIVCGMTTQPTVNAIETKGVGYSAIDLATTAGAVKALGGAYPAAGVLAQADWVNSHKATAQKVVDALVATMHWINTHTAADIAAHMPPAYVVNGLTTRADYINDAGSGQGPVPARRHDADLGPRHRAGDRQARRQRVKAGHPEQPPARTRSRSRRTSSRATRSNGTGGGPALAGPPPSPADDRGPDMPTPRPADHVPAHRPDQGKTVSTHPGHDNGSSGQAPSPLARHPGAGSRHVYAAPITAMILGDFGANVLKIEHPRGDPARSHGYSKDGHGLWWKVIARNKRAVTLNLSHPTGRELLERLAADADVLIENFRPGVMEKWGLGPGRLHEINPALVILRVTGFGQFGPYAKRRAFGTLAEAMTGFAHQTGQPDGPPTLPPFGLADGVTGLAGTIAVLLALYRRTTNGGHGQVIDVSLLEPLLAILGPGPSAYDQLEIVPGRHGNRSLNNAPRNTYQTRDGRWVAISASATSIAERVMRLVGRPDIAEQPWFGSARERVRHGDQLDDIVAHWIRVRDLDEVMAAFTEAGAAIAPIYDIEQLVNDPQIEALDAITAVKDEDLGTVRMQNVLFRLSESPGAIRFAGRRLGQDNDLVYGERLGLDPARIAELRAEGVI